MDLKFVLAGVATVIGLLLIIKLITPFLFRVKLRKLDESIAVESTQWLSFLVNKTLEIFHRKTELASLNDKLKEMNLQIVTLGNNIDIQAASTLRMKEADDVFIAIKTEWNNGPEIRYRFRKSNRISFKLIRFKGDVLLSWLGKDNRKMDISFTSPTEFDFEIVAHIFFPWSFSLTQMPLIGDSIKTIVRAMILNRAYSFEIPYPSTNQ